MRYTTATVAVGAVLAGLAVSVGANTLLSGESYTSPPATGLMQCEDWSEMLTQRECFAAGAIRNVSLYNMQGAGQFCKWVAANPGEWNRLKAYAESGTPPIGIVTWFGGHIQNDLQAYFAAGGPPFTILPNTSPNKCKTPLSPPVVTGVTPGQTDVTVTLEK